MDSTTFWFIISGYLVAVVVLMIAYAHSTWIQPGKQAALYKQLSEAEIIAHSSKSEVARLHDVLKYTNEMLDEEKRARSSLEAELVVSRKKEAPSMAKRPPPVVTTTTPLPVPPVAAEDHDATSRLSKTPPTTKATKEGTKI